MNTLASVCAADRGEWQDWGHTWSHPSLRWLLNNTLTHTRKKKSLFIQVKGIYIYFFLPPDDCALALTLSLPSSSAAEGRESIFTISLENSRSVITLSQAIKLLPRSDRWQMLEGLFIFCLLIRAARRGGGTGRERGARERYRRKGKTKGNTLFQQKRQLLLCATVCV